MNDAYREAYVALRRLATQSKSSFWKVVFLYDWTSRVPPTKSRIEADYASAMRSVREWEWYCHNKRYGKCRKYTLRCNKHVRMCSQWAAILDKLLTQLDKQE